MYYYYYCIPFSPAIPIHLISNVSITVVHQSSVIIPCHIDTDNSYTFSWTKDDQSLSLPHPGYMLLSNGSLYIQSVAISQQGVYKCTVSNSAGSSEGVVTLIVQG